MCESNAYIRKKEKEELFLESVALIRSEGGRIILRSLFGEEKILNGHIEEISLVKHKIILAEDS
ncbi:MAG: CooT family nickel-binding protein [Nitrospirota bacterium]